MLFRMSKLILVAVFLLWLGMITPAQAQSTCGDLSADDCDLLQSAQQATTDLSSATFRAIFDLNLGIEIFPDLIQVRLTTDGAYQRQPFDNADVERDYRPLYGLNADMSLILEASVSEFVFPDDNTFLSSFDLRYVDGMGYAELTKLLREIDPFARGGGWYSADVIEYIRRFVQDNVFPDGFQQFGLAFSTDYWGALAISGVNVARLADIQDDNQSFAVFEIAFTIDEYIQENPFLEEGLLDSIQTFLEDFNPNFSDDDLRQSAVYYVDLLRAAEFRFIQTVGLSDGYVHRTQFDFDFAPDMDTVLNPDPLGLSTFGNFELGFSVDFQYTQFDIAIPEIVAPEESSPVRYDDLFGNGESLPF
jgi:hypothetical protein